MKRHTISTDQAPAAIGTYSQAMRFGDLVFLSGQIPLNPSDMTMVTGEIDVEIRQVLDNLKAVCTASGGGLNDLLKITVFLIDMDHFPVVNEVMAEYFEAPYPARAAVAVAALPKGARVEMDAILGL